MNCGQEAERPEDDPAEFSRATKYVERCETSEGSFSAADEREVGPVGVALFLGRPSIAFHGRTR